MSLPGSDEPLAAVADRLARLVRDRAYLAFRAHLESDALPFGEDDWAEYDRYVALLEAFYTRVDEIPEFDADPWQTRAEIGATANAHLRALDAAAAAKRALPGEPAEDVRASEAAALAGSVAEYMAGREHAAAAAQLRRREDLPGLRAHLRAVRGRVTAVLDWLRAMRATRNPRQQLLRLAAHADDVLRARAEIDAMLAEIDTSQDVRELFEDAADHVPRPAPRRMPLPGFQPRTLRALPAPAPAPAEETKAEIARALYDLSPALVDALAAIVRAHQPYVRGTPVGVVSNRGGFSRDQLAFVRQFLFRPSAPAGADADYIARMLRRTGQKNHDALVEMFYAALGGHVANTSAAENARVDALVRMWAQGRALGADVAWDRV